MEQTNATARYPNDRHRTLQLLAAKRRKDRLVNQLSLIDNSTGLSRAMMIRSAMVCCLDMRDWEAGGPTTGAHRAPLHGGQHQQKREFAKRTQILYRRLPP